MTSPGRPRLLTIMGSGETAPTMVKVHRQLMERVQESPSGPPAVLLDTPYGFQENADDVSAKAQQYFAQSVGYPIGVASYRTRSVDPLTEDRALAAVASARYVFAGPGSPTYALRQWEGTPLPSLLAAKLDAGGDGGAVTFASAAALTLGEVAVPVYEIYKAGHEPGWRQGLGLLAAATGWRAAVIPHFDNAEGGHHDTRYCYLGERRLAAMEAELDPAVFVLGVDEHTALVLDLAHRTASVYGLGGVTVRRRGHRTVLPAGAVVPLDALPEATNPRDSVEPDPGGLVEAPSSAAPRASPLMSEATRLEAEFDHALTSRDIPAAVNAVLELDRALVAWSADTFQSDEPDRVRTSLRSMILRLGELAALGARDPRTVLGPVVEVVLGARARARRRGDWAAADELRAALTAAGVEVRDTAEGQQWDLHPGMAGGVG